MQMPRSVPARSNHHDKLYGLARNFVIQQKNEDEALCEYVRHAFHFYIGWPAVGGAATDKSRRA